MQSEGRPQTRSVFRQPMPPLCHGCLSSDRELSSIGEFVNMFRNLCDIKTPVAGGSTHIYLCWECTAMLKRFQMFRKQVNNAQSLLNSVYYNYRNKKSLPESLSRLKGTITNHDCVIINKPEPDIKPLEEIKEEIDLDEDIENTEIKQEIDQDKDFENTEFFDDKNDLENLEFLDNNKELENSEFLDDKNDLEHSEFLDDKNDLEISEFIDNNSDLENSELLDDKNDLEHSEFLDDKNDLEISEFIDNNSDLENSELRDDKNDLEHSEFLDDKNDLENSEFIDNNNDLEIAESFDDSKDFTYLEGVKSEDPTLIMQNIKKRKSFHEYKPRTINYRYIRSPEKIIVTEQARQSVLSDLWKRGRFIVRGSGANCKMCMKELSESESIETHNRKYHDKCIGPHVCSICSTRYPTQAELVSHVSSHNTIYCCVVCGLRSLTMKDAVTHASRHKRVVKCKLCRFYCLKVKPDYFAHYKLLHTQFVCDHCGKKCLSKRLLLHHLTIRHTELKCDKCGFKFAKYRILKDHIALVHTTDRTEASFCVVCNVQFDNRLRYQRHLATSSAHAFERQTSKNKQLIKCLVCDNRYKRKRTMMNHYRYVHLATTKFYCKECDKYFLNRTSYVRHQLYTHEGAKKKLDKLCTVCGRGFSENHILTNHMRTHTGERPFECAHCDARFAQRVARDTHQRKQHNRNNTDIKCPRNKLRR